MGLPGRLADSATRSSMRLEFFKSGVFSIEKWWRIFSNDPGAGMWLEKVG
jgi:hypothetical protein